MMSSEVKGSLSGTGAALRTRDSVNRARSRPSSFSSPTLSVPFQGGELEGMEETKTWDNGGDAKGKGRRENNKKIV